MQQWEDGLLLGFGADADENGIEIGVKLVMFDNSDPNNLKEVGLYAIHEKDYNGYLYSPALWDRKALLIEPEKNLIGVPVTIYSYEEWTSSWTYMLTYMFFSYEEGEFIYKGEISSYTDSYSDDELFCRAVYIDNYIYLVSGSRFVSADIDTISVYDEIAF